jgi:TPR repeat protein
MYLKGYGVLQDFVQSHVWFNISGSKGYGKARSHLEKLTKIMSADQVAEAQKKAKAWVESIETDPSRSVIEQTTGT